MKEILEVFGEIFFVAGESFSTDVFFILENLRIKCQMDAGKFEDLLHIMLSQDPFNN